MLIKKINEKEQLPHIAHVFFSVVIIDKVKGEL